MSSDLIEIEHLIKFFNPQKDDEDSDNDDEKRRQKSSDRNSSKSQSGDGVVARSQKEKKPNPYDKLEVKDHELEAFEVNNEETETMPINDWKKSPKWDITYRQRVTASDVFLQMGGKTPSTASCEDMVVSIQLPGEKMQNIDIKVLNAELEVNSPNFRLKVPLPHPVDPQKGNANWDQTQEKLIITLRMVREFDIINF